MVQSFYTMDLTAGWLYDVSQFNLLKICFLVAIKYSHCETSCNFSVLFFLYICKFSLTPLHLACWYGQESVVRLLLEHGANVNALDRVS